MVVAMGMSADGRNTENQNAVPTNLFKSNTVVTSIRSLQRTRQNAVSEQGRRHTSRPTPTPQRGAMKSHLQACAMVQYVLNVAGYGDLCLRHFYLLGWAWIL